MKNVGGNFKLLCKYIWESIKEYWLILLILSIFAILIQIAVLNMPNHPNWKTFLNILINVLISATSVFVFIESAIAYRNHKKFIMIKKQCYKSLNKFSEFFIENLINKFLWEHKKTDSSKVDKIIKDDLKKFLNNEINANDYFVREDKHSSQDIDFYWGLNNQDISKNYNLKKIEEIYVNYLLIFDKDYTELINAIFSIIVSVQEFEIKLGYAKSFDAYDTRELATIINKIINDCVKIYNLTKQFS